MATTLNDFTAAFSGQTDFEGVGISFRPVYPAGNFFRSGTSLSRTRNIPHAPSEKWDERPLKWR